MYETINRTLDMGVVTLWTIATREFSCPFFSMEELRAFFENDEVSI